MLGVLLAGALSQQMATDPGASFDDGAFTALPPHLVDMFVRAHPAD